MLALLRILARTPLRWLHGFGAFVGWFAYWCSAPYARRIRENLAISGICDDVIEYRKLLRKVIAQNGRALAELVAIWFRDETSVSRLVVGCLGWEEVESARTQGKSIIFMTPHMGCFEITAAYAASKFPFTVLYRPQKSKWVDSLIQFTRSGRSIRLAPADFKGIRMLYQALKRGESIGMLPDHAPGTGEGKWADFFGKPAYTMTLPRRLQQATGAVLMMAFAERLPSGQGYRLHLETVPSEDFDEKELNRRIESLVRRYPSQYYWNYNRYKKMSSRRQRGTLVSRRARR